MRVCMCVCGGVTCQVSGTYCQVSFFLATQTIEMHILAVIIMLHQHKFCVYKGKRKLKLLITCENFVLCDLTVLV